MNLLDRVLAKVLRRTSTNVAVATAAVKTVRAATKVIKLKQYSEIAFTLDDGAVLSFTNEGDDANPNCWNHFLTWYHGRKKSPCYVMHYDDGRTMIQRRDIKRYDIRNWVA